MSRATLSHLWQTAVAAFLILVLAFVAFNAPASPGAAAIATQQDQGDQQAEEPLTYDGRTFEQWQHILRHDLNWNARRAAYEALATFAKHGHEEAALETIGEVLATGFSPEEGVDAIISVGDNAMPYLQKLLQHENERVRQYVVYGLANIITSRGRAGLRFAKPGDETIEAVRKLALEDESDVVRAQACESLGRFAYLADHESNDRGRYEQSTAHGEPGEQAKKILETLAEATKDEHPGVANLAYAGIWLQEDRALPFLPMLIERMRSPTFGDEVGNSRRDMEWENGWRPRRNEYREEEVDVALAALAAIGPAAKEALPLLEEYSSVLSAGRSGGRGGRAGFVGQGYARISRLGLSTLELERAINAIKGTQEPDRRE